MSGPCRIGLILCLPGGPVAAVGAGHPPAPEPAHWSSRTVEVAVDSGPRLNRGRTLAQVFATEVSVPGASWLRLHLEDVELSGNTETRDGAFVVVRSTADAAEQRLDADAFRQWTGGTAFFNGDTVEVEIHAHPGSGESRLRIVSATAGVPPAFTASICGIGDDRALGDHPAVARLAGGCTAWLIDDRFRCLLGAGHCAVGMESDVVQFNVPNSENDGSLNHPPPEHQYVVDPVSFQFSNGGLGDDWAYFGCYPNPNTGLTPVQGQQAFFVRGPVPEGPGAQLRINGHGVATSQIPPPWNRVQKTSVGPLLAVEATWLEYEVDTTGGDSGSPIFDETSGFAIGIHTHGACSAIGGENLGTRMDSRPLQAAMASPRGVCGGAPPPPSFEPPLLIASDLNRLYGSLDRDTGLYGPFGFAELEFNGMTFDLPAGVYYLTTFGPDPVLVALDEDDLFVPGGLTEIGPVPGVRDVHGLAFDSSTGILYGVDQAAGQLYQIDPETASAVPLGEPAGGSVGGIAFDTTAGLLFGLDDTPQGTQLVTIDTTTGEHTVIGDLGAGATDCDGLAWCEDDGTLYTLDGPTGQTLRIDADSGAAEVVGVSNGSFGIIAGMACGRDPCFADVDGDEEVGVPDLVAVITNWGQPGGPSDVNQNGMVGIDDLVDVLLNWGPCGR